MTDDELAELDSCELLLPLMVLLAVGNSEPIDDRSFRLRSPDVVFDTVAAVAAAVVTVADRFVADFLVVLDDSFLRRCADGLGVYSVSSVSVCRSSLVSLSLRYCCFSTNLWVV